MERKQMRGGETGRGEEGKRWGLGTSRRMDMECPWNGHGMMEMHRLIHCMMGMTGEMSQG